MNNIILQKHITQILLLLISNETKSNKKITFTYKDKDFFRTTVKNFNKRKLSVNVTNLFDKVYINHLSLLKPLGIYDMGRNISLSVNVPLVFN